MLVEEIDQALTRLQRLNSVQIRSIAVAVVQALKPPLLTEEDLFAQAIREASLRQAEEMTRPQIVGELIDPTPEEPEIIDAEFIEVRPSLHVTPQVIGGTGTETLLRVTDHPRLPPRLRQTLECYLTGDSEKQVARKLSLSKHTVHIYTKSLYKRFGVNTRSELLAMFISLRASSRDKAISDECQM